MLLAASALVFAAIVVIVLFWSDPIIALFRRRTVHDARKFASWADDLYMEWSPGFAMRVALVVNTVLLVIAIGVFWLTGSVLLAALAVVSCYWIPKAIYNIQKSKRLERIEEQLPEAVNVMVSIVRAGSPLQHAIRGVIDKVSDPLRVEFVIISNEHEKGGLTLEEALDRSRRRVKVESFNMICSALIINSAQGGDVLRILEKMSDSIRELTRLKKKILTETTELRAQQKIIIFMTPIFAILICLFDPAIPEILFNTFGGNLILFIVLIAQVLSILWIRRIVRTAI